jgi:hypothetical protein
MPTSYWLFVLAVTLFCGYKFTSDDDPMGL